MGLHRELFNVVILPVAGERMFQLSASRNDRGERMVSPHWSEGQVRGAFQKIGTPVGQVEELFRGNRMAFGGRDTRRVFFTGAQLVGMGLVLVREVESRDAERG